MGGSVREMLEFLCRLCARTDKSCVNVFSSDGDKHFIQKKIRLCLPVIVEEQDEMPRQICLSCLNKLESTYEFYTTCIYAQSTIQRLLRAESLHDHDHVNKPGNETREKAAASFSLDQYLKRKIDPVDTGKSSKLQRTDNLEKSVANNMCVETTKASDSQASTSGENSNSSVVTTNNSEFQCGSTAGENINSSVVAKSNADFPCGSSAETQKPKLRVKTTSELRQAGQTDIVTNCVSARLSLQNSSPLSVSVPSTTQSTCDSASHSTSVVFSQSAVPQSSHSASSLPQHVKSYLPQHIKNSSASKGGTSWSSMAQNAKSASSEVQPSKSSSAPQGISSCPSVLQFSSSSSPVLQTATSSLSVPQNATPLLPMPKNTTVSLPVPNSATVSLPVPKNTTASLSMAKNAAVSLSVPQNVTNSSSVPQYSLSVPSSLSSGCTILPKVSQFIIMPNTFASAPTFTAAGTNTVTVLAQGLPTNVSVVADPSVPLGSATTLVAPQSARLPLPVSMQALTVSTTAAVPLASSSLPLVQTVPLQVTKQLPDPVMTSLTSAPAVISQSTTSDSVAYSVVNRNSQALVISSNSRATVSTSTADMLSKTEAQLSTLSQNLKVSSSSSVIPIGNAPAVRVNTEGKTVGLQSDTVVKAMATASSTVLSKHSGSAQLKTNVVAVSRTVSHPNILPKPATPIVTNATIITSNSPSILRGHLTSSVPKTKKTSLVQPVKTTETESTAKKKVLIEFSNKSSQKTVLCYSNQSATKTATAPTPVCLSQATVTSPQPIYSLSVRPLQQLKEGGASVIIKKTNCKSAGNPQLPVSGVVLNGKTELQLSDNQTLQKATVLKPQHSRGLPPPPPTVPLSSVSISENRKIVANIESADLQNGQAGSMSQANKSVLVPKQRGPVVAATVRPFTPALRPAPDPQKQSPVGPSSEGQVEHVTPSSQSPSAAEPGRSSTSSPPPPPPPPPPLPAERKEECPYCHVEFPADILIHHKTLHYREKFYTCIDCDKNFVTEKGLESHRCQKESKG